MKGYEPCIPLGTWHRAPRLLEAGSSHQFPSPTSTPAAALESCSSGDLEKKEEETNLKTTQTITGLEESGCLEIH